MDKCGKILKKIKNNKKLKIKLIYKLLNINNLEKEFHYLKLNIIAKENLIK